MNKWEKTIRENDSFKSFCNYPSFSSTLLDQIYRSIDIGEMRNDELKIFRETMPEKQSKSKGRMEDNLRRACLIEEWMDKTISEKNKAQRRRNCDDQDVLFRSSTPTSSDSSSGGFSSSDSESILGSKATPSSCFTPARMKPVRTGSSSRPENSEKKLRDWGMFNDYHYSSATEQTSKLGEGINKTKSKALKIYGNLKKVKQPISPGARLSSFLNSLFTKTRNPSMAEKAGEVSTCSTTSSFSRSCLSKNSSLSREKLRNGVKRTVRFSPESVIVDEDYRPRAHKCLFEDDDSTPIPVTIATAWRIGSSSARKINDDSKFQPVVQKKKDQQQTQKQKDSVFRELTLNSDEDDDAASYSSSDLFELDHLAVIGGERFIEDLPVYETTRIDANRAIANGFLI